MGTPFLFGKPVSYNLHTNIKAIVDRVVASHSQKISVSKSPNFMKVWTPGTSQFWWMTEAELDIQYLGVNTCTKVLVSETKNKDDLCWQNNTRKSLTILDLKEEKCWEAKNTQPLKADKVRHWQINLRTVILAYHMFNKRYSPTWGFPSGIQCCLYLSHSRERLDRQTIKQNMFCYLKS